MAFYSNSDINLLAGAFKKALKTPEELEDWAWYDDEPKNRVTFGCFLNTLNEKRVQLDIDYPNRRLVVSVCALNLPQKERLDICYNLYKTIMQVAQNSRFEQVCIPFNVFVDIEILNVAMADGFREYKDSDGNIEYIKNIK